MNTLMNGMENTYNITANEMIAICEALQNGYTLDELRTDDCIMSVTLKKKNKDDIVMDFSR